MRRRPRQIRKSDPRNERANGDAADVSEPRHHHVPVRQANLLDPLATAILIVGFCGRQAQHLGDARNLLLTVMGAVAQDVVQAGRGNASMARRSKQTAPVGREGPKTGAALVGAYGRLLMGN